jgi:hypothetical protein
MGQERECTLRIARRRIEGEALLETAEIIFRPVDGSKRLKFAFADIFKSVKAVDGELRFHTEEGPAVLELGPAAEKWAEKILHPKSRAEKLGVKSGMQVAVVGSFDVDFQKELRVAAGGISEGKFSDGAELIFVTENDVIGAGRKTGLKDVKVVGFSPTHTALKFVMPLDKR